MGQVTSDEWGQESPFRGTGISQTVRESGFVQLAAGLWLMRWLLACSRRGVMERVPWAGGQIKHGEGGCMGAMGRRRMRMLLPPPGPRGSPAAPGGPWECGAGSRHGNRWVKRPVTPSLTAMSRESRDGGSAGWGMRDPRAGVCPTVSPPPAPRGPRAAVGRRQTPQVTNPLTGQAPPAGAPATVPAILPLIPGWLFQH